MDRFVSMYKRVPKPPPEMSPAGAFKELCGSATRYDPIGSSLVAPYDKELVSWPPVGSIAADVASNLSSADRVIVDGWEHHILRDAGERAAYCASADRVRPFLEPTLAHRDAIYKDLFTAPL